MCPKSYLHIIDKKCWWENRTVGMFLDQIQFLFLFYFDRRTLKFLKMKCNPTNKKPWPYSYNYMSDQTRRILIRVFFLNRARLAWQIYLIFLKCQIFTLNTRNKVLYIPKEKLRFMKMKWEIKLKLKRN